MDIDPEVMDLAERNLTAMGLAGPVDFQVADAIGYTRRDLRDVDLCVLDAEGPKDTVDEDLRDKAIYYPITAASTPAVRPGGLLVAHNMLLENLTGNSYFARKIEQNCSFSNLLSVRDALNCTETVVSWDVERELSHCRVQFPAATFDRCRILRGARPYAVPCVAICHGDDRFRRVARSAQSRSSTVSLTCGSRAACDTGRGPRHADANLMYGSVHTVRQHDG